MLKCYTKAIKPTKSMCYIYSCIIKDEDEDIIGKYFRIDLPKDQTNAEYKVVLYAKDIMRKHKIMDYVIYNENSIVVENLKDDTISKISDLSLEIDSFKIEEMADKYLDEIISLHKICEISLEYYKMSTNDYEKLKGYVQNIEELNLDLTEPCDMLNSKIENFESSKQDNIDNCNKLLTNLIHYINNDINAKINKCLAVKGQASTSRRKKNEEKSLEINELKKNNINPKEVKVIKNSDEIDSIINNSLEFTNKDVNVSDLELDMLTHNLNEEPNEIR